MTATTDALNGAFTLDLRLRGMEAATRLVIEQHVNGVHVQVMLPEPRDVHAWAKQMGVEAVTGQPAQINGRGWWYRHTTARIKRDGLIVHVGAVQMALDPDDASMTEPVLP
jgi:hypothetical protein